MSSDSRIDRCGLLIEEIPCFLNGNEKLKASPASGQQSAYVWPLWKTISTKEGHLLFCVSRNFITTPFRNWLAVLTSIVLSLASCGCGGEQRAKPVDVELARATLTQVLDHWKSGGVIAELRKQSPEIVVQEALWSNGETLQDYALIGEPRAEDGNWFCDVELTLTSDNNGESSKKTVTYAVGTDPVLTVFRAMI